MYATEPYAAVWWAGPGDWEVDGDVDVHDLLAYLDEWFAGKRDARELQVWVGVWLEGA